ncbi:MAG: NAD(P)-dependent oxidoreductase [Planctomycetes bacterium]|nr:NAD(P)-dependent oxidoreductase [Planctomycetota bacterium]
MKRIIVTGAQGGTGRSIVRVLRDAGFTVIGVDLQPPDGNDLDYIQLDLRDAAGANDVFAGADGLIHFGSPAGDSTMSVTEAFHNIGVAGFNVFQAARNVGIRRIAWASSIMTYGNLTTHSVLPVTEDSPLVPTGIYGASKVMLENLAQDFCRWSDMSIAGFRLGRIIYETPEGRSKLQRMTIVWCRLPMVLRRRPRRSYGLPSLARVGHSGRRSL